MPITLEERLTELEQDPSGTDILDVYALLEAAGFRRREIPSQGDAPARYVFSHPNIETRPIFNVSTRTIAVSYLLALTNMIRSNLTR